MLWEVALPRLIPKTNTEWLIVPLFILSHEFTRGKINKATAHIWVVPISGDNNSRVYCKSPYKAMRYAFLLKKRTGLNISD